MFGRQVARIGFFQHHHPVIIAQLPRELTMPHIDRVDPFCAAGQQHIGEAPRGCADIYSHRAGYIDPELLQRVVKLQPAPADPGMILSAQLQWGVRSDIVTSLVDPLLAGKHQPGQDQRLRAGARIRQAAFHQRHVCACF